VQVARGAVAHPDLLLQRPSSPEVCCSTPTRVPWARSSPSWDSAMPIRCSGRPSTSLSGAAGPQPRREPALGIGLGGGGATSQAATGHRQARRHLGRRTTTLRRVTCQSISSVCSAPERVYRRPHRGHTRSAWATSRVTSTLGRPE